jgi:DNA primase
MGMLYVPRAPFSGPTSLLRSCVAGRVPEHVIEQILRSVDFLRIVGRHCELTRKGKNYWACCPFHEEKTPSFSVDPDKGLYHCFGCKEGGNVFTFLEKMEGLGYREALNRLAAEAGVDLGRYESEPGTSQDESARLRGLNELACNFYQQCLHKSEAGKRALDYLAGRRINAGSIEEWRLGYAPEGWEHILKLAARRSIGPEQVARAGLAVPREGAAGYYDRFRNRLMFPIGDSAGRVIGFGARALSEEDQPKYLNSPETPLFSKGRCFFGLAQARAAIRTGGTAVLLEGYTDVIMAHQEGVEQTLAVLGTALTQDHARVLNRLCERVVLIFDADEAGLKSTLRSIEVLLNEDLEILVATLPAGQDPCDYIVSSGGQAFRERIERAQGFFEYRLGLARNQYDTASIEGRMAAFRDVMELAIVVRDAAKRDVIVRHTAHELGIGEGAAWDYVRRNWTRRAVGAGRAGSSGRPERPGAGARPSAEQLLPGELLGLLLENTEFVAEAAAQIDVSELRDCAEAQVLGRLLRQGAGKGEVDVARFVGSLGEPALASAAARAMAEERARAERMAASDPRDRFELYLHYLERKRSQVLTPDRTDLDDETIRELERRLKELDSRSAESR